MIQQCFDTCSHQLCWLQRSTEVSPMSSSANAAEVMAAAVSRLLPLISDVNTPNDAIIAFVTVTN